MSYLGNEPADKFLTIEKQTFTTSATDTYTLDRSVSSPNDIELFLNNVRQEPTTAYTISGTTLTLASAITSSDSMYCIYQGRSVGSVAPASNSVTNDMLAGSIANAKLANSSITLNGSAVSLGGSATVGGNNTPSFQATMSGNQTISANTVTKIQFDTEQFDSDSAYDHSTNYRFTVPSGEGGKYFVSLNAHTSVGNNTFDGIRVAPYVNGSLSTVGFFTRRFNDGNTRTISASGILTLSASDYVEAFVFIENGTTVYSSVSYGVSNFSIFKLIGV